MSRRRRAVKPRTMLAEYVRWFASRGGKARAKALTTAKLRAIAVKGAEVWWSKKGKTRSP